MPRKDGSYREFDHTGDLGIDVESDLLGELFEQAALGMFSLLTDLETVRFEREREITHAASDLGTLMQNWLSELNFLHLTEGLLIADTDVHEISESGLVATVRGEPIDLKRHRIHTEIKAVTYHDLVVESRNDRWWARIIFDI